MEEWLACLSELEVPEDNLAWAKAAPTPEFPEPSTPYSLIVLPDFEEEEYVNRPEEDEVVDDVVAPSDEAAQLAGEFANDVMAPSDKTAQLTNEAGQAAAEGAGEDAALNLSPDP